MAWIILFVASWIIFFVFVDFRQLKVNMWCGVLAIALQLSIDTHAICHGLYSISNAMINILGSSLFFTAGPVFTIGTLFAQLYPKKKWLRIANVFMSSILFLFQEILLILSGNLTYTNWDLFGSITVNVCAMAVLGWFSIVVLNKKGDNSQ